MIQISSCQNYRYTLITGKVHHGLKLLAVMSLWQTKQLHLLSWNLLRYIICLTNGITYLAHIMVALSCDRLEDNFLATNTCKQFFHFLQEFLKKINPKITNTTKSFTLYIKKSQKQVWFQFFNIYFSNKMH